jgi:tripartite-type tricarboxylate transporter receptor subunit TctC
MNLLRVALRLFLAAAILGCTSVAAQTYPAKTVRIVVPFPPGGSADTLSRLLGPKLNAALGQSVVVENRAGAGGSVGAEYVARQPGDGYTVLMTPNTITSNQSLYRKIGYDVFRDFSPIALVAATPQIVLVHPSLPVKSTKELIAFAKARPGELSYATGGNGAANHLATELFNLATGIKMVHVPYKGNPIAIIDVISGQVPVMFDFMITGLPHVKAGKLRPLAVTSLKRSPALPELPTVAETLKAFDAIVWFAVMGPAGIPGDVVNRLHGEITKAMNLPDIRERVANLGADVYTGTHGELVTLIRADFDKWARVVKAANIRIE